LGGASFGGGGGPGGFAGAPGAAGFGGAAATGGFAGAAGAGGAVGLPGVSPDGVPPEAEGEAGAAGVTAGFSASAGRGGCFSSGSLVMSSKGVQKLHSCQALAAPKFRAHTHKSGANRTVTSNTRHYTRQPRKKIPGRQILPGKPCSMLVVIPTPARPCDKAIRNRRLVFPERQTCLPGHTAA
jgi:hypothetical protein